MAKAQERPGKRKSGVSEVNNCPVRALNRNSMIACLCCIACKIAYCTVVVKKEAMRPLQQFGQVQNHCICSKPWSIWRAQAQSID